MSEDRPEKEAHQRWVDRCRDSLVPNIRDSACFMSLLAGKNEDVDINFAVQIGIAILLDKPIVAVVQPGTPVTEKLARVADRFIEMDLDDPKETARRMEECIESIELDDQGCVVQHNVRDPESHHLDDDSSSAVSVAQAMGVITKAIQSDSELAHSWHCNVAMAAKDEGMDHTAAQRAANRFMNWCFQTTTYPYSTE